MPDALPVPDDLVQLQRDYDTADTEVNRFVTQVDATGEPWTDEQNGELDRLRAIRLDAVRAMHRHPTMVQARAEGCSQQTEAARRATARESAEA
jgi:hypothetical protein